MLLQSLLDSNSPEFKIPERSRLLYVVGQLRLGGLERQLYYLLANLDHVRHRPGVVVWNLNPNDKYYRDIGELKIPICGFPADWNPLSKLKALRAIVRQAAPEVIHSYGFHTNFAAYYATRGTRTLAIGSLRSAFARSKVQGGMIRGALNARWPFAHISNSAASAESARRHSGPLAPRCVFVVPNGLDLNDFRVPSDLPERNKYVASVGSLLPVKRWDRLLRAVQKLKSMKVGDVDFRIAGDGPLRSVLEKLAGDLGISRAVEFQGEVHDIPAFLRGAKFLVHTSESEGCPNAVMEAMASGLPIVAMGAGDIPYLVEDGQSGFVVRQDDEEGLVERISQLITDDSLCRDMGRIARAKAEREFGVERMVSRTLEAYQAAGWENNIANCAG